MGGSEVALVAYPPTFPSPSFSEIPGALASLAVSVSQNQLVRSARACRNSNAGEDRIKSVTVKVGVGVWEWGGRARAENGQKKGTHFESPSEDGDGFPPVWAAERGTGEAVSAMRI